MSEDQIIALLSEIRDLQKQSVENYKLALQKQQEAIDLQKQNVSEFKRRYVVWQRMIILTVCVVAVIAFAIIAMMPAFVRRIH